MECVAEEQLLHDGLFRSLEHHSGTKKSRPELDGLLAKLKAGDTVIVESLSRLGRSTKNLIELVELFQSNLECPGLLLQCLVLWVQCHVLDAMPICGYRLSGSLYWQS